MAPPLASFRRKPESSKTTRRVLLWIPAFARMTEDISWKHPMQKPAWGFGVAVLIEAFAEHPVAAAVLVLDAVIVARARLGLGLERPPPFGRDALRALRLDHAAADAPPGEACRRSFGDLGHDRQRLRRGQEKRRARRLVGGPGPSRTAGKGAARGLGQLGDVARPREETAHGACAQAVGQRIDERFGSGRAAGP